MCELGATKDHSVAKHRSIGLLDVVTTYPFCRLWALLVCVFFLARTGCHCQDRMPLFNRRTKLKGSTYYYSDGSLHDTQCWWMTILTARGTLEKLESAIGYFVLGSRGEESNTKLFYPPLYSCYQRFSAKLSPERLINCSTENDRPGKHRVKCTCVVISYQQYVRIILTVTIGAFYQ